MKPARIFQQCIWLVNAFRRCGRLTLEELNEQWVSEGVADGNPLSRSTFNRHRDAIADMYGVVIDCDAHDNYRYYIVNQSVFDDGSLERWTLSTLTVGSVLSDSASLKDHILLERVTDGEEYLQPIMRAIRTGKRILMTYQRFQSESYEKVVSPYALKLFHCRWYLLSFTGRHYATYALDRMLSVSITSESFKMPDDFSPEDYFAEYFGMLTDENTPMAHVVIRAYDFTPNYLRSLPLHDSQREIAQGDYYSDFSLDLRPTDDFIKQLLSHASGVEVLEPESLRKRVEQEIDAMKDRYRH
ncbi:MAG: WYL domain-containing protein [Prevotella sp.]|nr:WYL domain-containing protein [Prevotella sp.]